MASSLLRRSLNLKSKKYTQLYKCFKRNQSDQVNFIKTSMTQLTPEEGISLQITGYNQFGFIINKNIRVLGPAIIFPKTIYSWNLPEDGNINENSLQVFKMLDPRLDILVIGTGEKGSKINPNIPKWLIKNKINNFEILPTEKAINAFNFLVVENRFVGAALLPSQPFTTIDPNVKRVFDRSEFYKELEEKNPQSVQDEKKLLDQSISKAKKFDQDEKNKK